MSTRLPEHDDSIPEPGGQKLHVVTTPFGVFKLVLSFGGGPGQPDPLGFALKTFTESVEAGATDPLGDALSRLKLIEQQGAWQPLAAALLLLKQLSESGALPALPLLLKGSTVTAHDVQRALQAQEQGGRDDTPPLTLEQRLNRDSQN